MQWAARSSHVEAADDMHSPLALVAIVGRCDRPTDGVRDYCEHLSHAFACRGDSLEIVELRWEDQGWLRVLRGLWRQSRGWRDRFVIFQYTALMWSRHGFPLPALVILAMLKIRRVRLSVVFHDVQYEPARKVLHRLRVACKNFTIQTAFRWAEFPVLTVPPSQLNWVTRDSRRALFIPVGTNFPLSDRVEVSRKIPPVPTVAIFGVTYGPESRREARDIAHVIKPAASAFSTLRLVCFGRGTAEAGPALGQELTGTNVSISILGVLPPEQVRRALLEADVMLCVRGHISSRRGSAIAGIVCGIPIVGYAGSETAEPIPSAGVILVGNNDRDALAEALRRVLTDQKVFADLRQRNFFASQQYFSWEAIATEFARAFCGASSRSKNQDCVSGEHISA